MCLFVKETSWTKTETEQVAETRMKEQIEHHTLSLDICLQTCPICNTLTGFDKSTYCEYPEKASIHSAVGPLILHSLQGCFCKIALIS